MKQTPAPKIFEKAFAFYPLIQFLLMVWALVHAFDDRGITSFAILLFTFYCLAPLLWRLFATFYPTPTISYLGKFAEGTNSWWVSYQLQYVYISFPILERTLMLVPGLYSAWLRLWGAKIGKKVNWTPECKIIDRPFLEIGDRVLMGNRCFVVSHAVVKKQNQYRVFVEKVTIGSDSLIAYDSTLAPGVCIGERGQVEAGATLYPRQKVKNGGKYVRYQELLESGKYPLHP